MSDQLATQRQTATQVRNDVVSHGVSSKGGEDLQAINFPGSALAERHDNDRHRRNS